MHCGGGMMQKRTALTDLLSLHRFTCLSLIKCMDMKIYWTGLGIFYILFSI